MYKSYSSTAKVDKDTRVVISDFTAASVKLDVQLSGFPTSYSYYVANEEGSGITSKDVAKANATPNDWIGDGKATYTITREGIPSTLLKFESFKLSVDGVEQPAGTETDKTISFDGGNGYTTWGQKDIVATVTYTNLATGAPETASKTITRHITGLPYSVNFTTKPSEWELKSNASWTDGLKIGGSTASTSNTRALLNLHVPSSTSVSMTINEGTKMSQKWAFDVRSVLYTKIGNNNEETTFTCPTRQTAVITQSSKQINSSVDHNNGSIQFRVENSTGGCTLDIYAIIPGISISYRN